MSRDLKEEEFKEKSLKLLADPCKLKDSRYNPKNNDRFKNELEYKFNCKVSDNVYNYIVQEIELIIIVDDIVNDIISKII